MVKKGFTLTEVIVSMMILAIVAIGALPTLTKSKPQIEAITLRGQYACWFWDNAAATAAGVTLPTSIADRALVEWYFDERTPRTPSPRIIDRTNPNDGCRLIFDQRPAHYYILASAAGTSAILGNTKALYTQGISDELNIRLGQTSVGLDKSTLIQGPGVNIFAHGASNTMPKGIIPSNVIPSTRGCKVAGGPSCVKSCEVVDVYNIDGKKSYQVRFNGCTTQTPMGDVKQTQASFMDEANPTDTSKHIKYHTTLPSFGLTNVSSGNREKLSDSNNNYYELSALVNGVMKNFYFSLAFEDSNHLAPEYILGFDNNTNNTYSHTMKSKMSKLIDEISVRRKSALTEIIKNLNAGSPDRNGAVLILW